MAAQAAAQLLDELMGRNRNVAPNEKKREPNWEDPEYCPYFLVKFCPHDLFVNTRADLGACPKVHDEEVRKLYEQAKPVRKLHHQEEFVRFCSTMVNDVQRKIQKGKNRLALSGKSESPATAPNQANKNQEKIDILNERINGLEAEAEKAGTDGKVEQAQGLMMLCDKLKDERDALNKQIESGHWSVELAQAQEKQMEVCEVCGAFLIVGDAQQRLDDHLSGKQHLGFSKLKAAIAELTDLIYEVKNERRNGRVGGIGSPDEVSRDRDKRRERSRERNRSEHRNRDERKRSRSREKDRERERDRDKDKQRRERERSDRRDREKEKKHRSDRDHERRHHHHRR
ncbi:luc7-like protein 3 [Harmonia axyridis]|uniref:luc7-like protein 3 n=1 Tax=Harmonia axyridis TaxID=115357 RepID=UPI001E2798E7|nr:luc7-like protein 3 [Harmonia axyridis]XP_045478268.1 luc7-like protein 3 [Harmonia axyridis]